MIKHELFLKVNDTETQFLMIAYPEGWFGLTVQTSVDFSWRITYPG